MKQIRDFTVGKLIRISDEPRESIDRFGGGFAKREMGGTIQRISGTLHIEDSIYVRFKKSVWTFHLNDITLVDSDLLDPPKPQLFDPEQLILSMEE